ncbi:MAG TPA: glycerate kinase [Dermatophilaceae bacterium]|nr:glycerate kinase [Dermatophilaceae bacterium]
MRLLICPAAFSGSLTAVQAAEAMAQGWRARSTADQLTLAPLSCGGAGFLDVVNAALGGITVGVTVPDPLGRPVPAAVLLVDAAGVRTAYVEAAQASGLHLLSATERDPTRTSTLGVGQLIDVALSEGSHRIIVGVGGSATNDGGAGLLTALGVGDPAELAWGGARLVGLPDPALADLPTLRRRLRDVELIVATESNAPLVGAAGPALSTAANKGASPEQSRVLDQAMSRFADLAGRYTPRTKDLFTGLDRRLELQPGAGASGGLGYALMLLGGRRRSVIELVLEAWDFEDLLSRHDLVLTGQGYLDWAAMHRGVVPGVAAAAGRHALATVVLAGEVHVGRRDVMALGVAGAYAVAETAQERAEVAADPVGTLQARCTRLAVTWSMG